MVVLSGAHALIEALRREKVGVIFGILGGAILPVYDVLYDCDIRHVLARHEQCITPDARILLNDCVTKALGDLEEKWEGTHALSYDSSKGVLRPSPISAFVKREQGSSGKEVLCLTTLETSRSIKATTDHRFLSKRGWRRLDELKPGDKVAVYPHVEVSAMPKVSASIVSGTAIESASAECLRSRSAVKRLIADLKDKGLLPFRADNKALPIVARLLGHVLGDGGLSSPIFDKKRNEYAVYTFFTGKEEDLRRIREDLEKLGFKALPTFSQRRTSIVETKGMRREIAGISRQFRCDSKALWVLFRALGAPKGDKAATSFSVPEWLFRCPKNVLREFIAAYCGSEMRGPSAKTPRTFSTPSIHFHKLFDLVENAKNFAQDIRRVLAIFDVKSRIKVEDRHARRKDGSWSAAVDIILEGSRRNLINFCRRVGFRYSTKRQTLSRYVLEYSLHCEKIASRYDEDCERALTSLKEGIPRKEIMRTLGVPKWRLDRWQYRRRTRSRIPVSEVRPFKEWLKEATENLDSGLVWETIESISPVEASEVIDITVEGTHCFFANGFLAHNCAAHMSDGYARASGRTGVCMATSGPGATNLVTGIATAYMDSSPLVAFTGQVPRPVIGKDAFQETDIIGITAPITKHNYLIESAGDIPRIVKEAFHIAETGRKGPVVIDFPKDAQIEEADIEYSLRAEIRGYKLMSDPHPIQIERAVELLSNAERPTILAGGGVIASGAVDELVALAELLNTPVATSLLGKGSIPEDHPLSVGMIGMHGTAVANRMIVEADVLLAVGTRFSDRTTGKVDEFCPDATIIHVDIDASEIGKNVDVDIPIVADAKKALKALHGSLIRLGNRRKESLWTERVRELKEEFEEDVDVDRGEYLYPPKVMRELRKVMPRNAVVTTEIGQCQMWAALNYQVFGPRTFISSGGLGTMGFGFPAAIGAKVAKPDVPVVDIAGDGSFIMTEQDLACSVTEGIPVIVVIMDNRRLGMVAQWQRLFYGRRYSQVDLGEVPDFVKLAEAYGAQGFRVGSIDEFLRAMRRGLKSDVTTVIDVPISPEEDVFPMVPAGRSLKDMITGQEDVKRKVRSGRR